MLIFHNKSNTTFQIQQTFISYVYSTHFQILYGTWMPLVFDTVPEHPLLQAHN